MRFEEALKHLLDGKLIKIKDEEFSLIMLWDKNLQTRSVYISANQYSQAWCPQARQLESNDWEVLTSK